MPEPLDSDAAMPQVLFCYHGWPACSFSASSIRITPPSFSSFSHAPFPLSSNRLRCVWMQTKLALLALGNAVLTFLLQYGRVELHCIALALKSEQVRDPHIVMGFCVPKGSAVPYGWAPDTQHHQ